MLDRLRQFAIAVIFGVLGAIAGRLAADFRRQQAAGEQPSPPSLDGINLKPQDVVPGIVAAMRVTNRPWSWLHIPPWFAAFAVNFGVVAFARELRSFESMGRDALGGLTGEAGEGGGTEDGTGDGDGWSGAEPAASVEQGAAEPAPGGNGAAAPDG